MESIRQQLVSGLKLAAGQAGHVSPDLSRVEVFVSNCMGLSKPKPAPHQGSANFFPDLASMPWHSTERFPWIRMLEEAAPTIEAELEKLLGSQLFQVHPEASSLAESGSWEEFYLFSSGRKFAGNCSHVPKTCAVIEQIPTASEASNVLFAAMHPGTTLKAHCGPTNARLRCHLGLRIPPGCGIRVGDETRQWTPHRCFVFDDSFDHAAWNHSAGEHSSTRYVLIIDVWHPDLTDVERWALGWLRRITNMDRPAPGLRDNLPVKEGGL